jgi:hypothetical protein
LHAFQLLIWLLFCGGRRKCRRVCLRVLLLAAACCCSSLFIPLTR